MTENANENGNIFEAVQDKYEIREVAESLGIKLHKVGSSLRADSIADNGDGKDAFAIYEKSNSWFDFMLNIGGDITDLVAYKKYNGNKGQALRELMPEWNYGKISSEIDEQKKARKRFYEEIEIFHKMLFDSSKEHCVNALNYLHSRHIKDETIKALKIGIEVGNGTFRIRFPYFWKDEKSIIYYSTRRYDWQGRGEEYEDEPKYKKASMQKYPFLKNSILGLNTINRKHNELIITEGMFDWLHCYQQGFSVIAPNGCDFGKLLPEVIEIIKTNFKSVVLAFDNDDAGQDATYKIAQILLKERIPFKVFKSPYGKDIADFCQLGNKVETLINSARDGKKWAIEYLKPKQNFEELTIAEREKSMEKCKDFIKNISAYTDSADIHEILITLRGYFPKEWISELFKIAKKGNRETDVRDNIIATYKLMYNERMGFYEYVEKKGIWEARDETTIQGYISKAYGINATGAKLSSTIKLLKADERINSDIPITCFNKNPCVVFSNGTVHINVKDGSAKLLPYSEYDYATVRMPYAYNPKADCKNWKKYIFEATGETMNPVKSLQEFSGYSLLPTCKYEKALLLKGGGSNGKSLFTKIISAALGGTGIDGRGYVSAAEPSKFSKDFRLMALKNSWINISQETEHDLRGGEGVFKKITSGEVVEDSYKHKDPIPFKPRTKLIMCCNDFPDVKETSEGFMRRWLIVEFPMHYVEKEYVRPHTNDRAKDPNLEEKLMQELPGVFNWMLEGLQRLLAQDKFTEAKEMRKMKHEFMRSNNPVLTFAEDNINKFEGKSVHRSEIFIDYKQWAERNAIFPLPANRFYGNLRTILDFLGVKVSEHGRVWDFFEDTQEEVNENDEC